ncbi:MAG: GSCFA domain-containing protein [Bacteroidaceae bacterium]|nr:GSCFA domain-containing protein [Bacteroidaceae bacterium]
MGHRFLDYGLPAIVNPLGVLYNPASILEVVRQALRPDVLPLFQADGEWRCWLADTQLGGSSEQECREVVEGAFMLLGEGLRRARNVFLTLGTHVCYRLKEGKLLVSNCHKQPGRLFDEARLSLSECVAALEEIVLLLQEASPQVRIVLTVSPYRYAKYGFHQSQIAKSTLLLAVDGLCQRFPSTVCYFPAYEIIMDELRDYRFYASDMLHPSPQAVDYIWQRMVENLMDAELQQYLKEYEPIRRDLAHRPIHPDSPQAIHFQQSAKERLEALKAKYGIT